MTAARLGALVGLEKEERFNLISRAQLACSTAICLAAAACVPAQTTSSVQKSADIVAQMAHAQAESRQRDGPYIVTRDYRLFGHGSAVVPTSDVLVEITVVPPDSKKYIVENASGSGLGERVVRKMLDGEMAFAKDSDSTDITPENYDFLLIREDQLDGQHCYVLELLPKRKSKDLLRGTLWVDAKTYLPRRIEGEPAKSPSWWVRDVRIALTYGSVGPMWMQTSSVASADVRILGRSTLVWRDQKYQIDELRAGTPAPPATVLVDETTTQAQQ